MRGARQTVWEYLFELRTEQDLQRFFSRLRRDGTRYRAGGMCTCSVRQAV